MHVHVCKGAYWKKGSTRVHIIYVYTHTYIYTCTYIDLDEYICVYVCICMYMCIRVDGERKCEAVYMYIYMFIYTYIFIHIYIHTYIHTLKMYVYICVQWVYTYIFKYVCTHMCTLGILHIVTIVHIKWKTKHLKKHKTKHFKMKYKAEDIYVYIYASIDNLWNCNKHMSWLDMLWNRAIHS